MSLYLDASVVVSLFVKDANSERADRWAARRDEPHFISNWGLAEVSSALSLRQRMGVREDRVAAEAALDLWVSEAVTLVPAEPRDIERAREVIRRDLVQLRTPDSLHLAIVERLGAELATFDNGLAQAARDFGIKVSDI